MYYFFSCTEASRNQGHQGRNEGGDAKKGHWGFCRKGNHRSSHRGEHCWKRKRCMSKETVTLPRKQHWLQNRMWRRSSKDKFSRRWLRFPHCWIGSSSTSLVWWLRCNMTDKRSAFSTCQPTKSGQRSIKGIGTENKPEFALGIGNVNTIEQKSTVSGTMVLSMECYLCPILERAFSQ